MKISAILFASCLAFAAAHAADKPGAADQGFYQKAAEGGLAEVEAGKLAQKKGNSDAVKKFGAMMVSDHSKANAKLMTIASEKSVKLPTKLSPKHEQEKAKLEGLSGEAFDAAYVQGQIRDHEETRTLLQTQIDSGTDAQAKQWAQETLPTVEAHLKQVKALNAGTKPTG